MTESYYEIIEDKENFYQWFCSDNLQNMNPFDISATRSNRDIIKYLYEIIKTQNIFKFKLVEKRNNFFHYAAKKNECYPIVIIFYFNLDSIKFYLNFGLKNSILIYS